VFDAGRHRAQAAQAHAQYVSRWPTIAMPYYGLSRGGGQLGCPCTSSKHESISESAAVTATARPFSKPNIATGGGCHVSRGCDHGDHRPAGQLSASAS